MRSNAENIYSILDLLIDSPQFKLSYRRFTVRYRFAPINHFRQDEAKMPGKTPGMIQYISRYTSITHKPRPKSSRP